MKAMRTLAAALFAVGLMVGSAGAVVCDADTDPSTPENDNNCDCVAAPSGGTAGCVAVEEAGVCVAGDVAAPLGGCISLGSGTNICGSSIAEAAQCDDAACAAAASAGCAAASALPEPPADPGLPL